MSGPTKPARGRSRLRSVIDAGVLTAVLLGSIGLGAFVEHTTRQVMEGLPAELLNQQRDVAAALHELATLSRQLETSVLRGVPPPSMAPVLAQVELVNGHLERLRAEHEFNMLSGVAELHAVVAPAMQDVDRWLREGVSDLPLDALTLVALAGARVEETYGRVRGVMGSVNAEATALLAKQRDALLNFQRSLQMYLAALALVTLGVILLMVRYRRAEQRAARERERLHDSIESIDAGFALYDRDDRLVLCNSRYRSLHPPSRARMGPGPPLSRLVHAPGDLPPLNGGGSSELRLPGGRVIRVSEHRTSEGGTVGIYNEITDLRQAQDRLEHLANHDPLTGLANRHQLHRALDLAVARCHGNGDIFALMLLDLDRFKQVNDSFGHASGDRVLCRVGEVVRRCVRGEDTVARVGGDEFAILVERPRSHDELTALARRVLTGLAEGLELQGSQIVVTGSIGIAVYPQDGDDLASLERCADLAGYEAKRIGRDGFCFFEPGLGYREEERLKRVSRLRDALAASDGFSMAFWPVHALRDDRIVGLQATPRWRDAVLADMPVDELRELAEQSGLAGKLSRQLLDLSIETLGDWQAQGLAPIRVTTPIAPSLAYSPRFAEELGERLHPRTGAKAWLAIGLQEGAAAAQPLLTVEAARRLQQADIPLLLLGVGEAGAPLELAESLAPAGFELSRTLTERLLASDSPPVLVESVALLGRSLGAPLTAVGVDGADFIGRAKAAGCEAYRLQAADATLDLQQATNELRALAAATPLTLAAGQPSQEP